MMNFFKNKKLKDKIPENVTDENKTSFVDLTPTDKADKKGHYSEAILFALKSDKIKNIALTGPFGSGKSSIIKSFELKNKKYYKFLNISLAAFKEVAEFCNDNSQDRTKNTEVPTILIERSILQQMLYGADSSKLPYSRFKKISKPENSYIKATLWTLWIFIGYFLLKKQNLVWEKITKIDASTHSWCLHIYFVILFLSITIIVLKQIYEMSFCTPLKKISFSKGEVELCDLPDSSILNKHLDEIIYFFQETNYNVVVIEDLDRFGSPEIFVRLREINKLINDNKKPQGVIKFLYALKDDMFVHKDRTKFFDFIIPVVPVINSSNSYEKILERIQGQKYQEKLLNDSGKRFIKEVSLYLDDMRLIHNIFNEFNIYHAKLHNNSLDIKKLLAMMIYKNAYPSDFEYLHHRKGVLYELCEHKNTFIKNKILNYQKEIIQLKESLKRADVEKVQSVQELIDAYIGYIVRLASEPVIGFKINYTIIQFSEITTKEQIKIIAEQKNIQMAKDLSRSSTFNTGKSFKNIEDEINPGQTIFERIENIENNQNKKRIEIKEKINLFETYIPDIPFQSLSQLIQNENIILDEIFEKFNMKDSSLFTFLVKNGFLDDTYYLYTSNFYEGQMTLKDREFIIDIRSFNTPLPDQHIDNPKEVCGIMREEDFWHKYVLNITLMDYLLETSDENKHRIKMAMEYISKNFNESTTFISAYLISGKKVEQFIYTLSHQWSFFSNALIESSMAPEIVSNILKYVEAAYVVNDMNDDLVLTKYLSEFGERVFAFELIAPTNYEVLIDLKVKFNSLPKLDNNEELIKFAYKNNLYSITSENILYLMNQFQERLQFTQNPKQANYSALRSSKERYILNYVNDNIATYVERVFLTLSDNKKEEPEAIKVFLNNDNLDLVIKEEIISIQEYKFETFEGVPVNLWGKFFECDKITVSWKNISDYLESEDVDETFLSKYVQENYKFLSEKKISVEILGEDKATYLSSYLVKNEDIALEMYAALLESVPYKYHYFENPAVDRQLILAEKHIVSLSLESFSSSESSLELRCKLIEENFDEYLNGKENYPITDEVRKMLLEGRLQNSQKIEICSEIMFDGTTSISDLILIVSKLLLKDEADCLKISSKILNNIIQSTDQKNDALKIFVKCIPHLKEDEILSVLSNLSEPYSMITNPGTRPKVNFNELNLELIKALTNKNVISSYKEEGEFIQVFNKKVNNP